MDSRTLGFDFDLNETALGVRDKGMTYAPGPGVINLWLKSRRLFPIVPNVLFDLEKEEYLGPGLWHCS